MLLFKNRSFRISSYFEDSITTDLDIRFLKMMSSKRALTLTHNKTKEHIDGDTHVWMISQQCVLFWFTRPRLLQEDFFIYIFVRHMTRLLSWFKVLRAHHIQAHKNP